MTGDKLPFVQVMALRPAPGLFTYSVPEEMAAVAAPGARVVVPFGKRTVIGVIAAMAASTDIQTKPLADVLDNVPPINHKLLELILWTADYYFAPPGEVAALALPRAEAKIETVVELHDEPQGLRKSRGADALAILAAKGGARKLSLLAADLKAPVAALKKTLSSPKIKSHIVIRQTGWLKSVSEPASMPPPVAEGVTLTMEQKAAVDSILPGVTAAKFGVTLLHGVTGSGKTEVYSELIRAALAMGKSALVLAPEIAIADMLAARLAKRLGVNPLLLHSGLAVKERTQRWIAARNTKGALVVGARSAVFAPIADLGLIVVDEEHDQSYKQADTPRYNGRDVAIKRGQLEGVPVVLGAATPSMESYHNAVTGKYRLVKLPNRIDGRPMPKVEVVTPEKGEDGLGDALKEKITKTLAAGEQALIFLNRRGTSRVVECMQCDHVFQCKNCEISLVHHADQRKMRCHTCGYEEPSPDFCPSCGGAALREGGMGTKRIAQDIREIFPDAVTERLDRDAASKRHEPRRILRGMEEGMVDILVGTQMVTKGHDYAGITLVGAVSADSSLNTPDFRAAERTFQQITQAAGRAGRGDKPGEVVVLSRNPEHHSVQAAAKHDFEMFYQKEAPLRAALNYPPFCRMAMIRIDASSQGRGLDYLAALEPVLLRMERENPAMVRLGPVDATVFRVKNRYRWKILLKAKTSPMLAKGIRMLMDGAEKMDTGKGKARLTVDIDPVDVM